MERNFESCCRLCLEESSHLRDVFESNNGNCIVEIIRNLCSIEINRNESLPKEICNNCLEILTSAFNLRLLSLRNDRFLKGYDQDVLIKEEKLDLIKYEPSPCPSPSSASCENLNSFDMVEVAYDGLKEFYLCDQCPEEKSNKEEIQTHIQHDHLHVCTICSKQCSSQAILKQHLNRVHCKEISTCDLCNVEFTTKKKLEKHKQIHLNFEEKLIDGALSFECRSENCSKIFESSSKKMIEHVKYHKKQLQAKEKEKRRSSTGGGDESLVCPHCGQVYKSKQILQQHIKRHFDSSERYACPKCPQKFKSWGELYYHNAVHMVDRPFICDICSKGFKGKRDLKNHKKRHEEKDVKKFQCSYCQLMLKNRYTLNRHILIHTGQKPHECNFCQKSFTQKNELNKHLRVHVGENTYKCLQEGCNSAFRLLAELRLHQQEHYVKNS